jgi:hypothetical protein
MRDVRSRACARALVALTMTMGLSAPALIAEVKVEKVSCLSLANCLKLTNGQIEVVVTTDIGPRIIHYGLTSGENVFAQLGGSIEKKREWQPWGGHRLWIAPEGQPRSYGPDNTPIAYENAGPRGIRLKQPVEPATGIEKEIVVTLDETGSGVTVLHRLTNRGKSPFELAPWALTIMNGGGTAIVPQEPYKRHQDALLPARALVLWHYTDLADPRFAIGPKFIRLSSDASRAEPQKIGVMNKAGWAAYARQGTLFVKRVAWQEGATYPDYGSSTEVFTEGTFIEVETVGPLKTLRPGETAEHTERWSLFKNVDIGKTEADVERALAPILSAAR